MCNSELLISKLIPIYTSVENHKKRFESIPNRPQPNIPNFRNNNRNFNQNNNNNFQFYFNGFPVHSFANFFGNIFGQNQNRNNNNANNQNNNANRRRNRLFQTGFNFLPIILLVLLPTAIELIFGVLNFFLRLIFGTLLESEFFPDEDLINRRYRSASRINRQTQFRAPRSRSSSRISSSDVYTVWGEATGFSLLSFIQGNIGWILILSVNIFLNRAVIFMFLKDIWRKVKDQTSRFKQRLINWWENNIQNQN